MVLRVFMAMAAAAMIASPATAAEPAAVEGDTFEILAVALELGSTCKVFRGFEYHFLDEAWNLSIEKSVAQNSSEAARKEALDSGASALDAEIAGQDALRRSAAAYREKATKLGCVGGQNYLDRGRLEAYKQTGGLVAMIIANRGGAEGASPFPPLSGDEADILQAFRETAAETFGTNMPQFEAMIPELAQQRMARYPANPELGLARFIDEQSNAFAQLYHEALVSAAGWTVRGTVLPDGSAFGYHTTVLSKEGAPDLVLIAAPKAVTVQSDAWGKPVSGYIALGRRADGSVIAGLVGDAIAGASPKMVAKAQSKGSVVRSVTGVRVMDNCPYMRCFAFTGAQMASLVPGAYAEPVYVFAAPDASAAASGTRTDGLSVLADRLRALLAPR